MKKQNITEEERQGMKMIQHLQSVVGIVESDEKALNGWRNLNEHERDITKRTYEIFKKKE